MNQNCYNCLIRNAPLTNEKPVHLNPAGRDRFTLQGTGAAVIPLPTTMRCLARYQRTLPAEFLSTTLENTAVSDLSGRCEQKPMPT